MSIFGPSVLEMGLGSFEPTRETVLAFCMGQLLKAIAFILWNPPCSNHVVVNSLKKVSTSSKKVLEKAPQRKALENVFSFHSQAILILFHSFP